MLFRSGSGRTFASLHSFRRYDWTPSRNRAIDVVMASDPVRAAIDGAANALQTAVLLAAKLEADQVELRRAVDRAARALAALKPRRDAGSGSPEEKE